MRASPASLLTRVGSVAVAATMVMAGVLATAGTSDAALPHLPHLQRLPTSLSIREVAHPRLGFDQIGGVLESHRVPLRGKVVALESRRAGTRFAVAGRERTGPHGGVAFRVRPRVRTWYALVFSGSANFRPSRSGVVTARAFLRLPTSLSIREVAHPRLGFDQIGGVLESHRVPLRGKVVALESRRAGTRFAVAGRERTGPHGGVAFRVRPRVRTWYALVFSGSANFRPSRSGVVTARPMA